MSELKVAVLGIGRMGEAMVGTLARAGFDLMLFNRTRAAAEAAAEAVGAQVAATPAEAVTSADIVITSLADDSAVREVFTGPDGLVGGLREGTVVLEMSTIDPVVVSEIGPAVERVGGDLIDAPVSGSVQLVEQGSLTVMAGGDEGAIGRAAPVLDALAARVFHVGPSGAGATTKLAVNALVHGINEALAEALVLAEKAGVDRSTAYDVFASGAGGAPFLQYKRAAYEDPDGAPVAFSLDLVAKDLGLITGLGDRVGADTPIADAGLALAQRAIEAGLGARDMSAIAVYLRENS